MTTLKDLVAAGGLVSDVPVRKKIKFKIDGTEMEADIHVRQLSAGDYESIFIAENEGRSRTASIIAQCITLGENGKEKIDFKDAYRLHPALASAMVNAFNEVNSEKKS